MITIFSTNAYCVLIHRFQSQPFVMSQVAAIFFPINVKDSLPCFGPPSKVWDCFIFRIKNLSFLADCNQQRNQEVFLNSYQFEVSKKI